VSTVPNRAPTSPTRLRKGGKTEEEGRQEESGEKSQYEHRNEAGKGDENAPSEHGDRLSDCEAEQAAPEDRAGPHSPVLLRLLRQVDRVAKDANEDGFGSELTRIERSVEGQGSEKETTNVDVDDTSNAELYGEKKSVQERREGRDRRTPGRAIP
jgi:hypothetical protein